MSQVYLSILLLISDKYIKSKLKVYSILSYFTFKRSTLTAHLSKLLFRKGSLLFVLCIIVIRNENILHHSPKNALEKPYQRHP